MFNPNGVLHLVTRDPTWARTWAYSAYGLPVIQGSAVGIATAGTRNGVFRLLVDHTTVRSSKVLLVASSKS